MGCTPIGSAAASTCRCVAIVRPAPARCRGCTGGSREDSEPSRAASWGLAPAIAPLPTWRAHASGPAKRKLREVKHHAALPWAKIRDFIVQLRQRGGIAEACIELLVLTTTR